MQSPLNAMKGISDCQQMTATPTYSPVVPEMAKFCRFGKTLKIFWLFFEGLFYMGQNIEPNSVNFN